MARVRCASSAAIFHQQCWSSTRLGWIQTDGTGIHPTPAFARLAAMPIRWVVTASVRSSSFRRFQCSCFDGLNLPKPRQASAGWCDTMPGYYFNAGRAASVSELPTGLVTFLFTDIEGSTRLLQQLGPRYGEALAQERALLRAAFDRWGGYEVDTQGDAF